MTNRERSRELQMIVIDHYIKNGLNTDGLIGKLVEEVHISPIYLEGETRYGYIDNKTQMRVFQNIIDEMVYDETFQIVTRSYQRLMDQMKKFIGLPESVCFEVNLTVSLELDREQFVSEDWVEISTLANQGLNADIYKVKDLLLKARSKSSLIRVICDEDLDMLLQKVWVDEKEIG